MNAALTVNIASDNGCSQWQWMQPVIVDIAKQVFIPQNNRYVILRTCVNWRNNGVVLGTFSLFCLKNHGTQGRLYILMTMPLSLSFF